MANKVGFEFDPWELAGIEKPKTGRRAKKREMCELVLSEVLESCSKGRSPVRNGKWKRSLSPEYRKKKIAQGGSSFSDMELIGEMLDELECVQKPNGNLELRIQGKQAGKADGHNNHSGKSSLPPREFIPKDGETFKRNIIDGLREIANS